MVHLLRSRATKQQLNEMLEELGVYVKLAVDIRRVNLAGGGVLHADCEAFYSKMAVNKRTSVEQTGFRLRSRYTMKH